MQGGSSTHLHRGGRLPAPNCARSLRQDSGGGRVGAPPAPSFPAPGFLGRALTAPYSRPLRDIESPKDRRDPRRATPVTGIAAPAGTELGRRGPGQSVASPCRAAPGGGRARGARRQAAAQDWPPFPSHRGKGAGRRRTTSRADTEAAVGKRWAAGVHTACSRDQSVKYVSCYSAPQRPLLQAHSCYPPTPPATVWCDGRQGEFRDPPGPRTRGSRGPRPADGARGGASRKGSAARGPAGAGGGPGANHSDRLDPVDGAAAASCLARVA